MMNNQILELAEQAGLEYNFDPMLWIKYEKFAELIVKECSRIAESKYKYSKEPNRCDSGFTISYEILNQFGVK